MGLDGVELVMAVEDAFDIRIDDADAARLLTPRLLTDYVLGKVATTTATVCLTQRAFNLSRKAMIRHGGWKRSEIKPDVKLAVLIPRARRKTLLQTVTTELKIKSPPFLVRPTWVVVLFTALSVAAGLLIVVELLPLFNIVSTILAIAVMCVLAAISASVTQPLCREFPKGLQIVGDLARWVMTHKPDLACANVAKWTPAQVEARVREIIVEQLGVKPDFSLDANFVKDLGVD